MQYKKIKISTIFFLCLWLNGSYAQDAIPATGGNGSGSGGSVSYSVGQVVYTTNTGTNGTVAQGVQQPYEISVLAGFDIANFVKTATISKTDSTSSVAKGIEDVKSVNLKCIAYPNPTSDLLTLTIEYIDTENGNLTYRLFNINGKLLESKKVVSSNTTISMGNLAPATYILNVTQGNKSIKTFKIIKN